MRIEFKAAERNYIVDNPETDLLLTEVGMRLVDRLAASGGVISVEATESELREFLAELRSEMIRKNSRLSQPSILRGLARRLLPDYEEVNSRTGFSLFDG